MGEASETLKMLAEALSIPILVLAPHAPSRASSSKAMATSTQQGEYVQRKDADHVLFLYRENVSQDVIQEKSMFMTPLRIVSHHNGFVTDIALPSQAQQTPFSDGARASPPTSQDDVAS